MPTARLSPRESIEWQLIEALLQGPDLIPLAKANFHYQDFTHPDFATIGRMLWEATDSEATIDMQNLINACANEKITGIISKASSKKDNSSKFKHTRGGVSEETQRFSVVGC